MKKEKVRKGFSRQNLHRIIFEADTRGGKAFDVALLIAILISVLVVILESVKELRTPYADIFFVLEWVFTFLFSVEYLLRIYSAPRPKKYITSFYGLVDLASILPAYLTLITGGWQYLLVIRSLRLLRVARIFKLARFISEGEVIRAALKASLHKILVFIFSVLTLVIIIGSVMFIVEGPEHGFTNIPVSIYWAIVTLTTVGYGDIAPQTHAGQFLASLVMLMGYGIIAVPTGIVTVELGRVRKVQSSDTVTCTVCGKSGHEAGARYCNRCSAFLPDILER